MSVSQDFVVASPRSKDSEAVESQTRFLRAADCDLRRVGAGVDAQQLGRATDQFQERLALHVLQPDLHLR